MKTRFIVLILLIMCSCSFLGCNLKDDYIIKINDSSDEKLSNESIDKVYNNEDVQKFLDKLNTKPKEIVEKLDEVDSNTTRILKEVNGKADELSDIINRADFEGKSEDIKDKFDEISDKLDELQDKAEDSKDRIDSYENPVNKEDLSDTLDEFQAHMNNLESALSRLGN